MDWWDAVGVAVQQFVERGGLAALFVLVAVEEAGVPSPLPADLLVLLAAVQARQGRISMWQLIAVAQVATMLGASALYWLAGWAGRDIVLRYGRYVHVTPERLDRAERQLRRGGVLAVAIGRVLPGMRVVTAIACGVLGVPFRVFLPGMAIGALIYISIFAGLGYTVGPAAAALLDRIHLPGSSVLSLIVLAVVLLVVRRARHDIPGTVPRPGGRLRGGFLAGLLGAECAALLFNALVGLLGGVVQMEAEPTVRAAVAPFVDEARLLPILLGVPVVVALGAVWGALYGRWAEPWLRTWLPSDVARGLALAVMLWALAVGGLLLLLEVTLGEALALALVQAVQQGVYGAVLGLSYPLMRSRVVELDD